MLPAGEPGAFVNHIDKMIPGVTRVRIAQRLERVFHKMHRFNDINVMAGENRRGRLSNGALLRPFQSFSELRSGLFELAQLLLAHGGAMETGVMMRVKKPVDIHNEPS